MQSDRCYDVVVVIMRAKAKMFIIKNALPNGNAKKKYGDGGSGE
jgi:hypothetical protein